MKKWLTCALTVVTMTVLLPTVSPVAPAAAQAAEETAFIAALNQTRADVGLPALLGTMAAGGASWWETVHV